MTGSLGVYQSVPLELAGYLESLSTQKPPLVSRATVPPMFPAPSCPEYLGNRPQGGFLMSEVDMVRFLDVSGIFQIAVFTVGVTQLVKQLLSIEKAKLKVVATIIVGLIGGIILHFLPSWVFTTFLGVSVGVVFYDFILKFLERLVKGAGQ